MTSDAAHEAKIEAPLSLLAPLAPVRRLTEDLVQRLRHQILSGTLNPGAKLPTEQQLVASLGVSRTVVREAVAALRAEGLVITRQGVGAFVAKPTSHRPFRIDPDQLDSLQRVLDVMELRIAVETEAASLAAERRSSQARRKVEAALAGVEEAGARGEPGIEADIQLHRAIAEATGNSFFVEFLRYLGQFIIPRQSIRLHHTSAEARSAYLARVQQEHRRIVEAISRRDCAAARESMRDHLASSLERYRALLNPPAARNLRRRRAAR
jgi:GntR family transcriptional regulator, transcriptional repressor for pyruvate dehydrogenase complex